MLKQEVIIARIKAWQRIPKERNPLWDIWYLRCMCVCAPISWVSFELRDEIRVKTGLELGYC